MRKKGLLRLFLSLGLVVVTVFGLASCAPKAKAGTTFVILHTNDAHGHFYANKKGEGGLAAQKTYIDSVFKKYGRANVLLLSAGDADTGTPESDILDAAPVYAGMKDIGYQAMTVGNHEFDAPYKTIFPKQKEAGFPFISANIYYKATNKRVFPAYKMFTVAGLKVAVIGLTTEQTPDLEGKAHSAGLYFTKATVEGPKVLKEVEAKEHPDVTIFLTHIGHYANGNYGTNTPGDVTLARALPKGSVPIIVGGHSHTAVCMTPDHKSYSYKDHYTPGAPCTPDLQNGIYIVQADAYSRYVGQEVFSYTKAHGAKLVSYKLVPINLTGDARQNPPKFAEDPELKAKMDGYMSETASKLTASVGQTLVKLDGDRTSVRYHQTNLGYLIAKLYQNAAGGDFGIMNSGGVRASLDVGSISYKDVLTVLPFGETISKVTMNGAQIKKYLGVVLTRSTSSGGYPQISNLEVKLSPDRKSVVNIKIGGKPVVDTQTYTFGIPTFSAKGGDGYPNVYKTMPQAVIDTGLGDAQTLSAYFKKHGPVKVGELTPPFAL